MEIEMTAKKSYLFFMMKGKKDVRPRVNCFKKIEDREKNENVSMDTEISF
jgi:hypothetical protein